MGIVFVFVYLLYLVCLDFALCLFLFCSGGVVYCGAFCGVFC